MQPQGLSPSNRFLIPQRDRRWAHALTGLLVISAFVVLALALIGWPRLRSTSIHYELVRLRQQVAQLEERERVLELELEHERSPDRLAERARAIGLTPPAPPGLPAVADREVVR